MPSSRHESLTPASRGSLPSGVLVAVVPSELGRHPSQVSETWARELQEDTAQITLSIARPRGSFMTASSQPVSCPLRASHRGRRVEPQLLLEVRPPAARAEKMITSLYAAATNDLAAVSTTGVRVRYISCVSWPHPPAAGPAVLRWQGLCGPTAPRIRPSSGVLHVHTGHNFPKSCRSEEQRPGSMEGDSTSSKSRVTSPTAVCGSSQPPIWERLYWAFKILSQVESGART
jgi:hypothetical protein